MASTRPRPIKADPAFHAFLKDIQRKRIMRGVDKELTSLTRLTLAISRHPKIREDLEVADLIKDKRGQMQFSVFNLFLIGIVAFLAVVLFAGYIYVMGILNTTFHTIGVGNEGNSGQPGYVNLTNAADVTFGQVNQSIQGLRLVAICLIFAEMLAFIFMSGLVRIHPFFFIVYIFIVILAVIFAAPISNSYESLMQQQLYEGLLASFTGSNWLLMNLPLIIAVVGVIGGIFMFVNIITNGNQGVLQ